jgi:hypothetical protein
MFGTPVEDIPNRDLGVAGVMAWYSGDQGAVESVVETPSSKTSSSNQLTLVIVVVSVIVGLGLARVIKIRQRKTT